MSTVQAPVQSTIEHLLKTVQQLSPEDLREFTRQFAEWQKKARMREKQSEISDHRSQVERSEDPDPIGAEKEAMLMAATQARLPTSDEKRLKQLCQKSERGTLTQKELEAYRALAQQAEQLDVKRTEALAELVKLKGKSVHAIMEEIGWEEAPFE